jgi:uncharacterized protein YndB with AHSA1/START domain
LSAVGVNPRRVEQPRWLLLAALLLAPAVHAEVTAASDQGFVSEHTLLLAAPPARVYQALTAEISAWWDANHSYSGEAANFSLDARAGGCFCEQLSHGGSVMHMQVVFAQPGVLLRLRGGLGPLQGMGISGSMDFALRADPANPEMTLLQYRYVVSGYAPDGVGALAEPVDQVQLGQLKRLQAYLAAD